MLRGCEGTSASKNLMLLNVGGHVSRVFSINTQGHISSSLWTGEKGGKKLSEQQSRERGRDPKELKSGTGSAAAKGAGKGMRLAQVSRGN